MPQLSADTIRPAAERRGRVGSTTWVFRDPEGRRPRRTADHAAFDRRRGPGDRTHDDDPRAGADAAGPGRGSPRNCWPPAGWAPADQRCQMQPSFLSFVLGAGLAEVDGGWPAVEKAMEDATAEQSARLFRKIEYLSVIGNIAPMLGLLGTVIGMIFAFREVADTQGAARAADLAEGIYLALVTTVEGLIVAIPSLAAFAVFRNRVDQLVAEVAYAAQHVIAPLKRLRVEAASRRSTAAERSARARPSARRRRQLMRSPTNLGRGSVGFNMTPMIDVVFLLIIFFLVSSHLARQEMQLELDLPDAASSDRPEEEDVRRVVVNVLSETQILVGSQPIGRHAWKHS